MDNNSYSGGLKYTSRDGLDLSHKIDTDSANKLMAIHNGIREVLTKQEVLDDLNFEFVLNFKEVSETA